MGPNPPLVKYPITFPTLGWGVIDFIEQMLCHGVGDIQGDSIKLDDEECAWLCWAYRVQPQLLADGEANPIAGRRLVHRATYSRSKGQRKSEFGAWVCLAEAFGPVRCDGFDAKGEPVGKIVTYPFVRIMATEEEQSSNVYDNVTYILQNSEVAHNYAFDLGRSAQSSTRIFIQEEGGGEIVPSTSGDASKDGGKESFVAADESHLMHTKKLRSMYRTVARNTGKRKEADPWMADFTTAWQPGENSIAEQAAEKYLDQDYEECVLKHGVLFDHKQGIAPKIFNRDDSLTKALRTAYAPYKDKWTDFGKIVKIIRDAEDPEGDGYRYYLNIPRAGSAQWLYPEEVANVMGDVTVEDGESITMGFDGSESDDHTVLFGCRENGDLFTIGAWTPSHDFPGWREEVHEAVDWAFKQFRVVRFYGDPPYWQADMGQWAQKYGSPPVTEFWTNIDGKMAVATGALRSAIRREGDDRITIDPMPLKTDEIRMDGKTLVAWHFINAKTRKVRIKLDDKAEEAYIVRKDRPGSQLKIDSVPSAVLARRARDDAIKEDQFSVPTFGRASW